MAEKTGAGGQLQTFDAETGRYSWVKIDMTAPKGYVFASNNKSRFSGQRKTALIKL